MAVRKLVFRSAPGPAPVVRRITSPSVTAARAEARERMQGAGGLMVGGVRDPAETAADRVADQVMRMPEPAGVLRRQCAECAAEDKARRQVTDEEEEEPVRMRAAAGTIAPGATSAPASAAAKAAIGGMGAGWSLSRSERAFFEPRFGADFSRVRVHEDAAAARAARALDARAFTLGHDIAFAPGERAPGTPGGNRVMAHELAHVVQQSGTEGTRVGRSDREYGPSRHAALSGARSRVLQRAPAGKTQADYERLVKQGKWCRDSEESGKLHPGQQCYRQIPAPQGYPSAKQVCFNKRTGQPAPPSPDFISAVSGQKEDGTCHIPLGITDPPHPFSQRGRRALGHLIADIGTEDPDIIGRNFARFSGVAMGIALPKQDLVLGAVAVPAILGFIAGELGERGLPLLNRLAQKHGFVPTISLGLGSNVGLGLGVGFEKRDRPFPLVPVNSYLTFNLDSSLVITGEPGASSTFLAKVGVRIDPGKQGGLFALSSVGAGLAAGRDVSGAKSGEVGVGFRATDFLDVQVVRETVSGGASGDTYWLTLRLVAPQGVLKGHR